MFRRRPGAAPGEGVYGLSLFSQLADHRDPDSVAARLRARRLQFFRGLLESLESPVSILDVGGTPDFWKRLAFAGNGIRVTILNVTAEPSGDPHLTTVQGDARDLRPYGDASFDVVYSNSVIEHVGTFADQRRMASEIRRVGKRYFVKTPNARFPIEPHFVFPGFQFLPASARAFLISRAGWDGSRENPIPNARAKSWSRSGC